MNLSRESIEAMLRGEKLNKWATGGITTEDLARHLGITQNGGQQRMRGLVEAGVLVFAGRRAGSRIDGTPCTRPVYKLVPAKKGGKK